MGQCAVCGGNFMAGTLLGMSGLPSGIKSFTLNGLEQTMYAHAPDCVEKLQDAIKEINRIPELEAENPEIAPRLPFVLNHYLPDGPLRKALASDATDHDGQ